MPTDPPPPHAPPAPVWGVLYQTWPQPDGTLRVEYLSDGAEDLLELSADELARLLAAGELPITHPDPAGFYRSVAESAAAHTPWTAEFGWVGPRTGRARWLRAQDFPRRTADGTPYFSGVLLDVTREKETEQQLGTAYRTLSSHLDNTPLAVIEWDADFRVIRWSGQAERLFGWAAAEVLGKRPTDWPIIHPDDLAGVDGTGGVWQRLVTAVEPRNVWRNRNLDKAGRVLHCVWHNSVLPDAAGRVASVLSLVLDETAEVLARHAAARSEQRLRTALQYAGMLGWDYDFRAQEAYYSSDLGEYYGVPELVGYHHPDTRVLTIHPDDRPRVLAEFQAAIRGCGETRIEFRGAGDGPDGRPRWFVSRARVFPGPDRNPAQIVGVTTDVTDRRRAEEERVALERELHEARKRESLGLLAGGIAHDFNNILTIILGNVGVVRGAFPPDADPNRGLAEIETACHRAADLCRQIAAFAGTGRFVTENLDVNRVVRDAAPLLAGSTAPGVGVALDLAAGVPPVAGDPLQVRQLVLNLVLNGSDAVVHKPDHPAGGTVRVRTAEVLVLPGEVEPGYAPPPPPGRYAVIEVEDDGHGMDDATRAKACDPFFTTRSPGRGLGLAAVSGIIQSHRGAIRITSEVGRGTTVRVLLPATDAPAPAASERSVAKSGSVPYPATRSAPPEPFGGWRDTGTVLVADDEPNVRELAASLLEEVGFTVVAAADGRDGLTAFAADPARFRFALIDMMMPGLTGEELLREMRKLRPDLPVVVMTGFTNRQLPPDLAAQPGTALVVKPFRLERLLQVVRETVG